MMRARWGRGSGSFVGSKAQRDERLHLHAGEPSQPGSESGGGRNAVEVQQAAQPFAANGRQYPNAWVVLMDQPFSPLIKDLFEAQQWPALRPTPNGPPTRPYDVAGWILPMQMGVEVAAVLQPVT